jgi:hypothetical protein
MTKCDDEHMDIARAIYTVESLSEDHINDLITERVVEIKLLKKVLEAKVQQRKRGERFMAGLAEAAKKKNEL